MDGAGILRGADGAEADALQGQQAGAGAGELAQHVRPYVGGHHIVNVVVILDEVGQVQHVEETVVVGHDSGIVHAHLQGTGDDLIHDLTVGAHGAHVEVHDDGAVGPGLHPLLKGVGQHVQMALFVALGGGQLDGQGVLGRVIAKVQGRFALCAGLDVTHVGQRIGGLGF